VTSHNDVVPSNGAMTAYNRLARRILAPTLDIVRHTHVVKCLQELEESQWYSPQAIHDLQSQRLQETIGHAYSHVPFYRRMFDARGLSPSSIREPSDLTKLPILTKDLVRANLQDMVADNYPKNRLLVSRTGGSTGSPLVFYTTHEDWISHGRSRGLLAMEWADVHMGDRVATFPKTFGRPTRKERLLEPIIRRFQRSLVLGRQGISEETLPEIIHALATMRPKTIAAYPSVLALLAQHIRDTGVPAPQLHALLTGGELMFEHQRTLIREVFGKEPFSRYGSHENSLLGTECDQHSGFHMFAQDLVVEVVDDSGQPVPTGVEGHILITNLHARGMPFIRYDTGDIGEWATELCPCGRGLPLIKHLTGRSCDIIVTPSGRRVAGTGVGMSRMALLGISGLQLVQEQLDTVQVRLVVPRDGNDKDRQRVKQGVTDILHRSLGNDMSLDIRFVDHIEPTPAGKYVPVVSYVSRQQGAAQSQ